MAINNINGNNTITANLSSTVNKSSAGKDIAKQNTNDLIEKAKLMDEFKLSTDASNLTDYLNYNQNGSYTAKSSLVDFLNKESDNTMNDLFGSSDTNNTDPLSNLFANNSTTDQSKSSSNSLETMLNSIMQTKINQINETIAKAKAQNNQANSEGTTGMTTAGNSTDNIK
jgi:hypothetical protein